MFEKLKEFKEAIAFAGFVIVAFISINSYFVRATYFEEEKRKLATISMLEQKVRCLVSANAELATRTRELHSILDERERHHANVVVIRRALMLKNISHREMQMIDNAPFPADFAAFGSPSREAKAAMALPQGDVRIGRTVQQDPETAEYISEYWIMKWKLKETQARVSRLWKEPPGGSCLRES